MKIPEKLAHKIKYIFKSLDNCNCSSSFNKYVVSNWDYLKQLFSICFSNVYTEMI